MKKLFLAFAAVLITCFGLNAQNNTDKKVDTNKKMEDVVYLKNGAIVRGVIIEQVPDKTLEIKSNDNNYLIFDYSQIQKITRENVIEDATDYKTKGFSSIEELYLGYGVNTLNTSHGSFVVDATFPTAGIRSINGYQFNERFSAGFGVGFEAFLDTDKKGALIPFTLDARVYLRKGKWSPLLDLNGGYSIGIQNSSGIAANPAVGIKYFFNKKVAGVVTLGYKVQQQRIFKPDQYGGLVPKLVNYEFLQINAGFNF